MSEQIKETAEPVTRPAQEAFNELEIKAMGAGFGLGFLTGVATSLAAGDSYISVVAIKGVMEGAAGICTSYVGINALRLISHIRLLANNRFNPLVAWESHQINKEWLNYDGLALNGKGGADGGPVE